MGAPKANDDRRARLVASNVKSLREDGLDTPLLDRAVGALLKHDAEQNSSGTGGKSTLVEDDRDVHVQFSLARVPERPSPKPIRVDIPHPFVRVPCLDADGGDGEDADYLEDADICLLVSNDTTKIWVKDLIDKFPAHLGRIKKVLTLSSLRTKHKRFNQRRELLATYDIFIADDRILPMLGKALGKSFFEKKNLPVPIKITRKEAFPFAVRRCLRATYMYLSAGTCVTLKVGTTAMPPRHLAENVQAAVKNAVEKLPRKWANVSGVFVKTARSVALPVYSRTPEELVEIAELAGITEVDVDGKGGEEAEEKKRKGVAEGEGNKKRRKKELAAKSPLLKALKKQKEEEGKKDGDEGASKKGKKTGGLTKSAKKKGKQSEAGGDGETGVPAEEEKKKAAKSVKKKKKEILAEETGKSEQVSKSAKKKKKSANGAKEREELPKSAKKKKTAEGSDDLDFVAAKKFKGSRKAFHFRSGREGLGYYRDVVPIPDRAALEAMTRALSSPDRGRGGSGGGKRRKSGGSGRRGGGKRF